MIYTDIYIYILIYIYIYILYIVYIYIFILECIIFVFNKGCSSSLDDWRAAVGGTCHFPVPSLWPCCLMATTHLGDMTCITRPQSGRVEQHDYLPNRNTHKIEWWPLEIWSKPEDRIAQHFKSWFSWLCFMCFISLLFWSDIPKLRWASIRRSWAVASLRSEWSPVEPWDMYNHR